MSGRRCRRRRGRVAGAALALFAVVVPGRVALATAKTFVSPQRAQSLVAGGALFLDARGDSAKPPYAAGVTVTDWRMFRQGDKDGGRGGLVLTDRQRIAESLGRRGIDFSRPVVVIGDWRQGWGEEGRVAWTLLYFGHPRVFVVRGGYPAWRALSLGTTAQPGVAPPVSIASTAIRLKPRLRRTMAQVKQSSLDLATPSTDAGHAVLLDVRQFVEYKGATPYGSRRGGHVAGAKHLHWKDLLGVKAATKLLELGVHPDDELTAYCVAGVRSAMATLLLHDLGYSRVANYDGSIWQWATTDLPLTASEQP